MALGVRRRWHAGRGEAFQAARHALRQQSGRVNQRSAVQCKRLVPARAHDNAAIADTAARHRRSGDERCPGLRRISEQRQHQAVAVDDSRCFGKQSGDRLYRRLKAGDVGRRQRCQRHAVGRRPFGIAGERRQFRLLGSDQYFADPPVADAALDAVAVKQFFAAQAQRALQ